MKKFTYDPIKVKCPHCQITIYLEKPTTMIYCMCRKTSVDFDRWGTNHHRILYQEFFYMFDFKNNKWLEKGKN